MASTMLLFEFSELILLILSNHSFMNGYNKRLLFQNIEVKYSNRVFSTLLASISPSLPTVVVLVTVCCGVSSWLPLL